MTANKKLDKELDSAWSELVKLKARNRCEYCGKRSPLNSHHIFSRSNRSVRWDTMNGMCLCVGCHTFSSRFSAHKTPTEFTYWLEKKKGKVFMQNLTIKAYRIKKWHKFEKEVLLKDLRSQINKLRSEKQEAAC